MIIHETKRRPHGGTVAKVTITKVVRIHHFGTMNVGMKYHDMHTITIEIIHLTQCQLQGGTKGKVRGTQSN